jgi:hypothetical protein
LATAVDVLLRESGLRQIKASRCRLPQSLRSLFFSSEDHMRSGELYFLIFVCGSFGALSLALAVSTIRYYRWRKQVAGQDP